ncbi:BMP family ABC transporter substrate-binding protein [Streptomyces sp. B1866]|uniref:BMP family lipoprotein n=1 Tax=Streptomyces sp. B1866 TaxID=3075431 RepID=UPI00289041F9|nr:BMP family ABC transporter substrate-binding protein [Streptomyces sp. B1866]MDT3398670.1 BMP family ABC transporter substrate-binding protein [Streptomyces sp. B1866]
MRRVATIAAACFTTAALAFTATGCGSSSEEGGKDQGVGLAYDVGGRGDHSFNDSAAQGYDKALKDFKIKGKEMTAKDGDTDADRYQKLADLAEAGFNPVVAVGYAYTPALTKAAQRYKDTDFAIIDSVVDLPNVASLVSAEQEGSYLAGVAAGLKTKTDKVGFIGGTNSALIKKFAGGFQQGLKDTNAKATLDVQWVDPTPKGFGLPDRGKDIAEGMLAGGVDVIYSAAGGSGVGAIEATAKKKGAWSIGVDGDQYYDKGLAPYRHAILTSMVKNVNGSVYDYVKSVVQAKKPETGVQTYDLKKGGVALSYSGGFLDDVKPKIEAAQQKIVAGEIKVTDTYKD